MQATGFQYNAQKFKEAGASRCRRRGTTSRIPRLKGKVALYNFSVAFWQDLLVIMTKISGGTEKDVRPGLEKIKAWRTSGLRATFAPAPPSSTTC